MKIAIIGQQDFGKAVLEAFLARGDEVAAVFCAPEKEGARPDALRAAAEEKKLKVHQFKSLRARKASSTALPKSCCPTIAIFMRPLRQPFWAARRRRPRSSGH